MKNMIRTHLTAAERQAIEDLVAQIEDKLAGKTVVLTEEERKQYGAINEQNKLFVNKVRDYRQSNPAMSAPDVDWDEFELDYQSRHLWSASATASTDCLTRYTAPEFCTTTTCIRTA